MYEANERDFRITLIEDAMSGLYERGKAEMQANGVEVCKTAEPVAALSLDNRG
jgi:hypothetical protein